MTIIGSTNNSLWTFKLEAYELSWDINTNTSVVRVDVYIGRANSRSYCGGNFSGGVNVDGQYQGFNGTVPLPTYINGGEWYYTGVTRDFTVGHNDDGSKATGVYANWSAEFNPTSASASGTLGLTTIPRASTITATSSYIEEVSQLTITRKSNSFSHIISYNFGGETGYINADGSISQSATKITATSIGFRLPASWYSKIPNSPEGVGNIYIATYNGDTKIGDESCPITARVNPSTNRPILNVSVIDTNSVTLSLTNDNKTLVKGYSIAELTWSATAKNSSTIKKVAVNGTTVTTSPYTFIFQGKLEIIATDSRELSTTLTPEYNFINYFIPNVTMSIARKEPTSDVAKLLFEGTWFNNSFGLEQNTLNILWQYREYGTEDWIYGEVLEQDEDYTINGNNVYSGTYTQSSKIEVGGTLTYNKGWDIKVILRDKLAGDVEFNGTITKGIPVFWWDDSNFYVTEGDIYIKGEKVEKQKDQIDYYSSNEIKTHKIWIDGKPIYRKVVTANVPWGGSTQINLASLNIDNIKFEGTLYSNSNIIYPFPYHYSNGDLSTSLQFENNILSFYGAGSNYSSGTAIVILEYTKK